MSINHIHRFLKFTNDKPSKIETNQLAAYIINLVGGTTHSVSKLKKFKDIQFEIQINNQTKRGSISLDKFSDYMCLHRQFNVESFGIPKIECDWLDGLNSIALKAPPPRFAPLALLMPFGSQFPLSPCIDREGVAFRTLQSPLQQNIIHIFNKLVDNSHSMVSLDFTWLNDFRMLLNDCISVIDVTLHQLYLKAQYGDQTDQYLFNIENLGPRTQTRLADKLKWIGKITGRPLENAQKEIRSFKILKNLRNHLNHFDPPCFAYTIEDVANWLNLVQDVGRLLWRIREKLRVQLNPSIIAIILLPQVEFVPINKDARVPQPLDIGYGSTDWKQAFHNPIIKSLIKET
jgi:hypothetical protein